ncbi:hypothetical protein EJD97_010401 [Solanum chilense]|uniref:RNase H type-1 domain-containing protein n=1 Tax=Solanum chilense TaxID=4083 RepID=A0A6N2BQP4_SOLCI|nr:hypothetical protein EJD97_010401 [Solanum chilense]
MDIIEHIFNKGYFETYVWKSLAAIAEFTQNQSSLQHLLTQWRNTKHKNGAHKLLLHATPFIICWNLWMNRCERRYGGTPNMSRVKHSIYMDIYTILTVTFPQIKWPATWKGLFQIGETRIHETKVKMIAWKKPQYQWIKVNTDGNAIDNSGMIGVGGIIRDQQGKILMAFSSH